MKKECEVRMKKKIRIPLIIIIVIIIVIVGIIIIINKNNKNEDKQLLKKQYDKLLSMSSYQFTKEKDSKNKTIVAKSEEETSIDNYSNGTHTTTIIKDGKTYYILHDREEYYIYNNSNVENTIVTDWIKDIINNGHNTGIEKIRGRKLEYEEYEGLTMFSENSSLNEDESKIKTRFYFDKTGNLAFIKTIYPNSEEIQKIEITSEINEKLFNIPATYAEN